jgi:hypothetical protein
MNENLDSRIPPIPAHPRQRHAAAALPTSTRPVTTVPTAAAEPKSPPFRGD